jgi:hypothetical protein
MPRDRLVLSDRAGVTEPGGRIPAAGDRYRRQDEQHLVDDCQSMLIVMAFSLLVMLISYQLDMAHEFGEAKSEDDEVDAAKAERRKPDDDAKKTNDRGRARQTARFRLTCARPL